MWVIVVVVIIIVIVVFLFYPKKKNIPVKYEKAKKYLEEGDIVNACYLMNEIIVFPISGKYSYEEARQMLKSLQLLKDVLKAQNINKDEMIDKVIAAFEAVPMEGGKVKDGITTHVENFVNELSVSSSSIADTLIDEAKKGNIIENGESDDKDFVHDVTDDGELAVINSIGKYLLTGRKKEGIAFIDTNMPEEMGAFKACLLDQKAALLFMNGQIKDAVGIYEQLLTVYPDNNRIRSALAEGLVELGRKDEAVNHADIVVRSAKDKNLKKTANKILSKYSKQ
jgi:tetratricopeptide (TPR) repeat protein